MSLPATRLRLAFILHALAPYGLVSGCAGQPDSADDAPIVGRACEHGGALPSGMGEPLVTPMAAACDGDPCIMALAMFPPSTPCTDDAACNVNGFYPNEYRCEQGACVIDEAFVLERSMCAPTCESSADCKAFDEDTTCVTGFSCSFVAADGPLCCQKQCVCNDDLGSAASTELERDCAADAAALCGA